MKVDVVASLPHYLDHMLPIFEALPAKMQGTVHPLSDPVQAPRFRNRACMVAGWQDVQPLRGLTQMVYVEHGAGQSYAGDVKTAQLPGYSASRGARHQGVVGFIAPNERVAKSWKTAPAIAVGCPKLDKYLRGLDPPESPSVCIAFHWPCTLSPEAGTALHHFQEQMPEIVSRFVLQGFKVYGHAHPRWNGLLDSEIARWGAVVLKTDEEVFRKCDILIVDNSSIGVEFMALGKQVIWMNSPAFRRDVHHGGRFWDWTEGIPTVDSPAELVALNLWDHMPGSLEAAMARRSVVQSVYAHTDGSSSRRAADFIAQLFEGQ